PRGLRVHEPGARPGRGGLRHQLRVAVHDQLGCRTHVAPAFFTGVSSVAWAAGAFAADPTGAGPASARAPPLAGPSPAAAVGAAPARARPPVLSRSTPYRSPDAYGSSGARRRSSSAISSAVSRRLSATARLGCPWMDSVASDPSGRSSTTGPQSVSMRTAVRPGPLDSE